jgi:methylmalonyl-CoA mutase
LRLLWYQVSQVYSLKTYRPGDLQIQAACYPWINPAYEPHGNLINSTASAMAAILGGCNALTVVPQDNDSDTFNRIGRNVSSLLREESNLDKVADPTAGSYALDVMTDTLAKKAWNLFQDKMKS